MLPQKSPTKITSTLDRATQACAEEKKASSQVMIASHRSMAEIHDQLDCKHMYSLVFISPLTTDRSVLVTTLFSGDR